MTGTTTEDHRRSGTDRVARGHTRGMEWTVAALELVVAVNAVVAGIAMLANPLTPLGTSPDLIADSPFSTYTWPGVLLLVLNGLVPGVLAVCVIVRIRWALLLSAAWGVGLVAWIVTQWFLLSDVLWLQYVLLVVGVAVAILGIVTWRRHDAHRYPAA